MKFLDVTLSALLLLVASSSDAALLRGEGERMLVKPANTGKPDNPGNSNKPETTGKPDNPGNSNKPDCPGNSCGDKGEADDISDEDDAPWKQPDWESPCADAFSCRKNGNGPDKFTICWTNDEGKNKTSCLPETNDIFNTTITTAYTCGACSDTEGDYTGPPFKDPAYVPPCGEKDFCGSSNGNGPNTYTLCKVDEEGNQQEKCMPETSGQFNFTEYPANKCGACTSVPIVTTAPVTAAPAETIIIDGGDGGTIEIGIDDGQVTIPGGTIGPDDIVVDIPDLPGFCFSGSSTVEVKNKGYVKMMDLSLGHMVKVDENNKFEPIYSFGHKDHDGSAKYLQITTSQTKKPLEISADHMVTIEGGRYVPASSIKVGDRLVTATDDQLASVTNIKGVVRKGVFAPFTQSGTIVVNDVVASNYITFQDSEYLKIGSVQIPFTYHWLSHAFNSIHRLVVQMVGITQETYTEEGISHWAGMPHKVFSWLLHQNSFIFGASVSLALPIITMVWCFEWMLLNPLMIVTVAAGGMILLCQNNAKATKKFF